MGSKRPIILFIILLISSFGTAYAGPIFLTGHDPDFHAPSSGGAQNLLNAGLDFVTGGTHDDAGSKFLWVEGRVGDTLVGGSVPVGHRIGENGLAAIGLTLGTHYDRANGSELAGIDFSAYTAIAVASSFGGLLTRDELDALIARKDDIKNFVNDGGGLMALAECDGTFGPCGVNLLGVAPDLFGFLPISVNPVTALPPFAVTPYGMAQFGLTFGDVNDPTHNSFNEVGGLNIVDVGSTGIPTTLAGVVRITDGGFAPEPATMLLFGTGFVGLVALRRRRHSN